MQHGRAVGESQRRLTRGTGHAIEDGDLHAVHPRLRERTAGGVAQMEGPKVIARQQ